jgi:glucose 1-dehydrogenase
MTEQTTPDTPILPKQIIPKLLKGQKALVTGANSGIGKAVAIALGEAGADVVVNYVRAEDSAREVVETISNTGSRALAIHADVSEESQVQAMFAKMIEKFGTIDILVNNAGVQQDAPFDQMTLAEWNTVIGINLTGQFLCAREAVREFKRRGLAGRGATGIFRRQPERRMPPREFRAVSETSRTLIFSGAPVVALPVSGQL